MPCKLVCADWCGKLGALRPLEVGLQTVSLYNKVITAFVKEAAWRKAMWLLHDMPERQVRSL
jgi:hypothetical protein